ncbi:Uu.00g110190.m01.CDS01 [Anthostomella pinea]|uniref:Uu.00g110190.m01.CDS01 n=1 Tax=Anthostomella pinea TaxID=933095 RepID=A0AAI8VFJ1_9PEZI|nr:Uu.00g110190.m01.CDS01 [Anthostomella pinea]
MEYNLIFMYQAILALQCVLFDYPEGDEMWEDVAQAVFLSKDLAPTVRFIAYLFGKLQFRYHEMVCAGTAVAAPKTHFLSLVDEFIRFSVKRTALHTPNAARKNGRRELAVEHATRLLGNLANYLLAVPLPNVKRPAESLLTIELGKGADQGQFHPNSLLPDDRLSNVWIVGIMKNKDESRSISNNGQRIQVSPKVSPQHEGETAEGEEDSMFILSAEERRKGRPSRRPRRGERHRVPLADRDTPTYQAPPHRSNSLTYEVDSGTEVAVRPMHKELQSPKNELTPVRTELNATKKDLDDTKAEMNDFKKELIDTKKELSVERSLRVRLEERMFALEKVVNELKGSV